MDDAAAARMRINRGRDEVPATVAQRVQKALTRLPTLAAEIRLGFYLICMSFDLGLGLRVRFLNKLEILLLLICRLHMNLLQNSKIFHM